LSIDLATLAGQGFLGILSALKENLADPCGLFSPRENFFDGVDDQVDPLPLRTLLLL
jgi:hypothetical protein